MSESISAKCLCGAVMVTALNSKKLGACHCSMCRTWSGGPFISVECGPDVNFKGESYIVRYPSSAWAERGFCKNCGTHLFYWYKQENAYFLPAGLFADDDRFTIKSQIFIDEKPHYYALANDTVELTGDEVMAQFNAEQHSDQK